MTTKIPVELSSTPGIVDNSDATAITIDSSERVGIGITSPTTALEVIGDIKIKEGSAYSNYGLIDVSEAVLTLETYSVNTSSYPANIIFKPAGTERMRIDSNGNVLIGSSTSIASNIGLQVTGTNAAGFISLFRDDSSIVADDDLGGILFYGDDNSATTQFAYMRATAEGTHSDGDNPTALRFGITLDGSETPVERFRINSSGNAVFSGDTITVGDSHTFGNGGGDNLHIESSSGENLVFNAAGGITVFQGGGTGENYGVRPVGRSITELLREKQKSKSIGKFCFIFKSILKKYFVN